MKVTLISTTKPDPSLQEQGIRTAEDLIVYCARVSNPDNQLNVSTGPKLLRYCIEHGHWSVFEQASMTVEITTSRAISAQILRHRSFSFQEFSQRYAVVDPTNGMWEDFELREKAQGGNRQGSGKDLFEKPYGTSLLGVVAMDAIAKSVGTYHTLIQEGVAPECARMVLPLCTRTTLYMTGCVRSWIHYLKQRLDNHAQKEHRDVAGAVLAVFKQQFPVCDEAAGFEG